jgi:hypothetical protein
VQDGVDDAFTKRLAETAGAMKVADGFEPGAVIGPLIDKKAVEKVEARIADAVKKGAKVVTGGPVPRSTASRPRPRPSRWPTTPSSVSRPISTAATPAASGASPGPRIRHRRHRRGHHLDRAE